MKNYKGARGKYCRKIWQRLRELVKDRAGNRCELCGAYEDLQVDHCFSASGAVRLRYDIRNLTLLCGRCHTKKTYCMEGFEKLVDEVVRLREGSAVFKEMQLKAKKHDKFTWSITDLEKMAEEICGNS